jgi:hypothetical protein
VKRRRFKRRLFWTAVIVALLLIWLVAQVFRAAGAIASAARHASRRLSAARVPLTRRPRERLS